MLDPEDLPLDEFVEIEPGLELERRCFLKTTALALSGMAVQMGAPLRVEAAAGSLTLEQFVEEVVPVARKLVADTSLLGQDHYLLTLATSAVQLADVPVPEFRDSGQGAGPGTWIGSNGAPGPFVVLHWKMDPNTEIRRHAHTYGNVVTLGLEGAAHVENFEMLGERDFEAPGTFRVRRTVSQWLTPGGVNLVNLERNYIHGFRAGQLGARGLDITTRIREKRPTPYLDLSRAAKDAPEEFEASWTD